MPRLLQWMWTGCGSAERVGRVGERLQDGARRDARVRRPVVEPGDVALADLPGLDAAGIHDLDGVAAGGAQQPGGVVAGAVALAGLDLAQQVLVVPHQHEDAAVHARRVVQLRVAVPGHERRDRRIEGGGVAQTGVAVAGGEGARDRAAGARPAPEARRRAARAAATGSAACSSGISRRAWLQLELAKWEWMSTPPGITTMPRASSVGAPAGRLSTMRPSSMQTSRISPSTPLAGSWTVPPVIRSRSCAPAVSRTARSSASSVVAAPRRRRAGEGRAAGARRPSGRRCRLRGCPATPVSIATRRSRRASLARGPIDHRRHPASAAFDRPRQARMPTPRRARRRRRHRHRSKPASPGLVARRTARKVHRERVAGLPGQHRFRARAVAARPERAERGAGRCR